MPSGEKAARIAMRFARICICSGTSSTNLSSGGCCAHCAVSVISWPAPMYRINSLFRTNSLRFRVAIFYAIFGAGTSILFSAGVFFSMQHAGHRLMDEILLVELNEHASYPVFVPPVTDSVTGYVLPDAIP